MSVALEAHGVSKKYGRRTWALNDVELSIDQGGVVGLVGPNGAGKSTLLKLWVGFEEATRGKVSVVGLDPWSDRRHALARIAYLGQAPGLYHDLTAADHLDFVAHYRRGSFDRKRARDRLEELRVPISRRVGSLSGGQAAQVGLAICLGMRADVVLLDEPLASLDPLARREFLGVLTADVAESGATAVLSSHNVADVELACSRLVVLGIGRVRLAGRIREILSSHRVSSKEAPGSSAVARLPNGLTLFTSTPDSAPLSERPTLDDVVLGYLAADRGAA
jgi:ABC-2 type transport system ATP-binding protein